MWRRVVLVGCAVALIIGTWAFSANTAQTPRVTAAPAVCGGLFFSEYVEGTSNNKAVEVYNGTGATIDLSGYSIQIYSNGSTTAGTTINLAGSVADGAVFVLANSSASSTITAVANQTSGSLTFNGNDAVTLRTGTTVLDVIGQIGTDPGTEWGSGLTSTADNTLRRKSTVSVGDSNGSDAFDPAVQWDGYATDTFDGLGAHTAGCAGSGLTLSINDVAVTEGNSGTTLASFTVSLSAPAPAGGVTFDIATADNTATVANGDYVARSLTGQTIAAGNLTYIFDVTVNGDTNVESNETFYVNITNLAGTGATIADGQGTGTITNDDSGDTLIHDIQGSGAQSSLNGASVAIQGVVVGDYQGTTTGLGGFFVQEEDAQADADPATSEGIFVYDGTFGVAVNAGDVVRVQGRVLEYLSTGTYLTEITTVTQVSVVSTGASVTPATINLPVTTQTDLERYEGMLVTLPQTLTVADNYSLGYYGEVGLAAGGRIFNPTNVTTPGAAAVALQTANDLRRIVLDDGSSQSNRNPVLHPAPGLGPFNTLRAGDTLPNLSGVLDQRFGTYRIQPISTITFTAANPRPTVSPSPGGTLRVMSGNLLNYFTTIDTGAGTARGADSAAEFTRQRDKLINVLIAVNADVVGSMELENNATAAIQDLVNGLNAVAGAGTYAYINTGVLGTDAIRVVLIYKPSTVTPVGSYVTDLNAIFSRPPLAQTFRQNSTGETFNVVVNHFKSKGCSSATGLDLDQGDGQGCYNDRRKQQATRLISFINTTVIPTSGDADVLIVGDLNAYSREDPITILTNAGYTNLVQFFNGSDAYSYAFDGQIGYLDHALASPSMLYQTDGTADWHINADEPIDLDYNDDVLTADEYAADYNQPGLYDSGPFRASDHDPILIGLTLVPLGNADFGDLDRSYGRAWHTGAANRQLGAARTFDSLPVVGGDNASDDGVTRVNTRWQAGNLVTLEVTVTGGSGWLTGWFDWNRDGDFADANEQTVNQAVNAGSNAVSFAVPVGALVGNNTAADITARFRLYESPTEPARPVAVNAANATGGVTGGEVEDYVWSFGPLAVTLRDLNARSSASPIGWGLLIGGLLMAGVIVMRRRAID